MTKEGNNLGGDEHGTSQRRVPEMAVIPSNPASRPTPPTPAGAGTETPRTDAAIIKYKENTLFPPKPFHLMVDGHDYGNVVAADFARKLELTSLRRQAEADRATNEELRTYHDACIKELYRMLGVDGSDGEYRFKWAALEFASKLSQLASADKDRERIRAALEMASGRMAYMAGAFGNRFSDEDKNINRVVFKEIRAALQPSPSLDHGATGETPKL